MSSKLASPMIPLNTYIRLGGFVVAMYNVDSFIADQYPTSSYSPKSFLGQSVNARIVAYQLGNIYGLLALSSFFVLRETSEPRIARNFITCLAVGDIGHLATCYWGMGSSRFMDVSNWNSMAWGNIGGTVVFFLFRVSYLLGLFNYSPQIAAKTKAR